MKRKSISLMLTLVTVMQFSTPLINRALAYEISRTNSSYVTGNLEVLINLKVPIMFNENSDLKLTLKSEYGQYVDVDLIKKTLSIEENEEDDNLFKLSKSKSTTPGNVEVTTGSSVGVGDYKANFDDLELTVKHLNYSHLEMDTNNNEENPYIYNFQVDLNKLPLGKYYIEVSGDGFKTIESDIFEIKDYSKRVIIGDGSPISLKVDVNDDGESDKKDYDLIEENIGTDNLDYDINKDSVVDIEDLTFAYESINYKETNDDYILDTSAIIDTSKVEVASSEGLTIEGDVKNLFNDSDEGIKLNFDNSSEEAHVDIDMGGNINAEQISLDISNISSGKVVVEDENGNVYEQTIDSNTPLAKDSSDKVRSILRDSSEISNKVIINLGQQVAIKKIKIVVTNPKNDNLAEIGKVQFINNVVKEIPKPEATAPDIYSIETAAGEIKLKWYNISGVEGYEIKYYKTDGTGEKSSLKVRNNSASISGVEDFKEYTVEVRSYSGSDWKGDIATVKATPQPTKEADAPENISISGKFNGLNISWKKMSGATSYNLYYKKQSDTEFEKIEGISSNSYSLESLNGDTVYEVKLTSVNDFGESGFSKVYSGQTLGFEAPIYSKYKLINTENESGETTDHIVDIEYPYGYKNSEYPNGFNKFNIVDNDYSTYWQYGSWNAGDGGSYYGPLRGPIITFDDKYKMDTLRLVTRLDGSYNGFYSISVAYWENGQKKQIESAYTAKKSSNGKVYYEVKLKEPITTDKLQIGTVSYGGYETAISEIRFYHYDSLEDDVKNLFKDDMRVELKDDVTSEQIEELKERANTVDPVSNEYHPQRDSILADLKIAEDLLADKEIAESIVVDQTINNGRNGYLGFAMQLNDYQPLGVAARAGDEISVYVGTEGSVMPELVFTQYYPESGTWNTTVKTLKKGKNVIQVPTIGSLATERGGSVYVRYPNSSATSNEIKVRVSGGTRIPYLNVTKEELENKDVAKQKIEKYITSLETFVNETIPTLYADGTFDERTSVLNSTEIATKKFLLTLPASEVLKGIDSGANTLEEKTEKLYNALLAWEELGNIAYGAKGLYENPDINNDGKIDSNESKNAMPSSRLNIRYTRMFAGAFMYATSGHIGVEFDSVAPLVNGTPATKNSDGTITNHGYYGWGISHEMGHVIDEGNAVYSETTNNIISLTAQTIDDKTSSRLETDGVYSSIYDKINSGAVGLSGNVFVNLGMFWQLHLAYDDEPSVNQENSFFAKLNRLYRANNESTSTQEQKDNLLIRLASDAAGKDLTEYFTKWGLVPNETTLNYMKEKGYAKEERAIYYLNDEARRKRLSNIASMANDTNVQAELNNEPNSNKVTIKLSTDEDSEKIFGYEIFRNGEAVGFTTNSTYVDEISMNNRVYNYEVVAYDYYLNKTKKISLDPIKVMHDGSLAKSKWEADSNTYNENYNICEDVDKEVNKAIDNDTSTYFVGDKKGGNQPDIVIDLNSIEQVSGIKYTAAIGGDGQLLDGTINKYKVYVSEDKENWTLASEGNFNLDENKTATIYFNKEGSTGGKQLWTYKASYIKIVAPDATKISAAEIGVIGNVGDNIDLSKNNIGRLSKEFRYGQNEEDVIPEGSIVFTGGYRGNPIFNAMLLKDKDGNVIEGEQIFMAEVPENGEVGEVSEGTWIYYITPDEYEKLGTLPESVKAELYRVNDAETLDGQRLVSDTLYVDIPESLEDIEFDGGIVPEARGIDENNSFKGIDLE